ncbi:Retrovirus-related Pol polyprotein from transposon TNT 1-94 [Symbiodinium microadriaticum]|uniref:Retrovirus-related Pol polyprotein from transposon TNT 1-94 n=1 Tax=Symbiodinium microadriaticum TaxID=2951 RepID=A0A1Q9C0I4_SYMMI|nr:Retrovirus-related Pol polyprotein from transposon TNT 1-94 [Symbiodinium microadriaticum]
MGSVTARAATWMSRIGDLFQQRRVEVHTSWSPANHGRNPWVDQPPFVAIPPPGEHDASRDAERSQPSSSGSAAVPYELVQAEVSKQLEGALGSMMARLEAERVKAEEAEQQAEMLRSQLEAMELQAQAMARGEYSVLIPLQGLRKRLDEAVDFYKAYWGWVLVATVKGIESLLLNQSNKDVMTWYTRYSTSTPLERVQLLPVRSSTAKPEWARVERRATAMTLTAIPANLKEEVIATGGVTTVNLLAKLFSTYQPGNRQEKALVLANLEKPAECTDAKGAVEALRKWALWRRRAMAIGITEPDATVLLQGLDRICGSVVRADSELAFRVSLIRSTLQVDTCPNAESVTRLFQHLQAELEQQARLGVVRGTETQPKLKAIGTSGESTATTMTTPPTGAPTRPAAGQPKFFLSERGCRRGKECRYPHTWSAFEKAERAKRCLVCGGTGHKSKECKAPGGGAQAKPKDGPQQQHPKDSGATPSSAPSSGSSSPTRRVGFDSAPEVLMKVISVLEEVKRVKAFAPLVEAVDRWSQRWASPTSGKTALMDSGATHPLRQPRDEKERREAMDVRVALAGDAKTTMKQTVAGTLLSGDVLSQVIVPLGRVINSLGYQLRWTANDCALLRGDHEVIPLRVVRGCPEADEHVAQQLIRELEQTQIPRLQDATMDSVRILRDVEVSWWSCLVEYVATGDVQAGKEALRRSLFFTEEDREELCGLLLRYPNDGGWCSMKDAGLNRRTRKRLMRASTWVVRWDPPGFTRPSDVLQKVGRMTEVAYLNVGSIAALGGSMAAWKVLLWAATQGRIGAVLTKDLAATPAELQAHHLHRAKVHFLHALAAAGMCYKGSAMPRLLVERRRGAAWDALDWMCDGRSQRYVEEMGLPDPRMRLGKQHRATLHPTGYTLSIDVAGPLRGAGKSPDGKFFKYFLVGAFRIPLLDGGVTYDDELRGHPIPEEPEPDDTPVLSDDDQVDVHLEEEEDVGPIAEERRDQEEWERLKAKFKAPLMTETLYFCVPMNSKKSLHILPALQQMVIDIRGLGYPVTRVHSDRGGELRSNAIKRWVLNQGIMRTTSTGSEPAENGVAEAGVRFLKRRGRILLDAAELGREHWPTAIQSAALQQRCDKLGLPSPMPVAYGAKVYVKTKKYKTGDVESMKAHWIQGKYLGPSTDVRGGDYEDMVEAIAEGEDQDGEQSYSQEEIMMKVLKAQEKQAVEAVAKELLSAGDFSKDACQRLLRALGGFHTRWKTPRTTTGQGMVLGAFVRGGSFGVTSHGKNLPNTMRFLNKFLMIRLQYTMPGSTCTWTTLALQRANQIPAHRDVHNQRGTRNYVMEIADESLEGLWIEGDASEHPVEGGDGLWCDHEYQTEDGQVLRGRVHSLDEPVAFDPRSRHAMVNEPGMKWVLSAYTPAGVHSLLQADVDYLFSQGFPVTGTGVALPSVRAIQRVSYGPHTTWETTPMESSSSHGPEFVPWSGSRGAWDQEEVDASVAGDEELEDEDEAQGDWELYVEESEESSCVMEPSDEPEDEPIPRLRVLCSAVDPGGELDLLSQSYESYLGEEEGIPAIQEDMARSLEDWETLQPRLAKVEPKFTTNIEELIAGLQEPLRHTHNVNPQEVRSSMEKWRAAIVKELGVVEKGFYRTTVEGVKELKKTRKVQELPAKLVYTIKPPVEGGEQGTEEALRKRKARIVCCGNFNSEDPGDVFASGAAAESLRCALTLSAWRRWFVGGVDIGGAFMLTPLDDDVKAVLFAVTPPAILVRLGLVQPTERWILTRAMYGLRQSPKLWSLFRDKTVKGLVIELQGRRWRFKQGVAEPNLWYLFEEEAAEDNTQPSAVSLIYVDDLLICGPLELVRAIAESIGNVWKISELDVVEPHHGTRFLGCEIEVNESRDTYWIHQKKPYVMELIRQHCIPETARAPIPCARELLTLTVDEGEAKGDEAELRRGQRLCGELLWLSQRSRPDIAFPVSIMGSLLTKAAPRSIEIGMRLLSYLQRTVGVALELKPESGGFEAWSDCSFAPSGCRSHSGMAITWNKAVIGWRSGRQPFTCLSTAEGELVAAIETLTLAMSLKAIVDEFGEQGSSMTLCIDNQAALTLATPGSSANWRTRHLRIRSAFLREKVDQGEVVLRFVLGRLEFGSVDGYDDNDSTVSKSDVFEGYPKDWLPADLQKLGCHRQLGQPGRRIWHYKHLLVLSATQRKGTDLSLLLNAAAILMIAAFQAPT